MIVSRVRTELKVTIPDEVRDALGLREGDDLEFAIEDEVVRLKRRPRTEGDVFDDPFSTFTEWESEADEKGYANL